MVRTMLARTGGAPGPAIGGMNPPAGAIASLYALLILGALCASAVASAAPASASPKPAGGPPAVTSISPRSIPGGKATVVHIYGRNFTPQDRLRLDGVPVPMTLSGSSTLTTTVTVARRGTHQFTIDRPPRLRALTIPLEVQNQPPIVQVTPWELVAEEFELEVPVGAFDPDGDPLRVFALGLPPGAHFDERARRIRFTPDFIQGGEEWHVRLKASDGMATTTATMTIEVVDTVHPIEPVVTHSQVGRAHARIVLEQRTDEDLSGPPFSARSYETRVCVPRAASENKPLPVRLFLHGAEAQLTDSCADDEFRIFPYDPETTYWWGYGPPVPENHTQRRLLHILDWVLKTFPGADPDRVYVMGSSMGGSGSLSLGLLYARHVAYVDSEWAQTVPRHQRPGRIKRLNRLWGPPPKSFDPESPWDLQDYTRVLRDVPDSRDQFIFLRHGKDDAVIHFGAAVLPSELTKMSFYRAMERFKVGHYVVWDEGGHGPPDPVLGKHWWDGGWKLMHDPTTFLRRNLAFPAFTESSANDDPGDGKPKDKRAFNATKGYAGKVSVPGDTGWSGAVAGAMNRWLRWDARKIVDTLEHFEIPLYVVRGSGKPSPEPGYPSTGDLIEKPLPIIASVTPRRTQAFRCLPGELLVYRFGTKTGTISADEEGAVTIPKLPITDQPTLLEIHRAHHPRY